MFPDFSRPLHYYSVSVDYEAVDSVSMRAQPSPWGMEGENLLDGDKRMRDGMRRSEERRSRERFERQPSSEALYDVWMQREGPGAAHPVDRRANS